MRIIEGPRLYLRKLEETDLDRTWVWLHRPDVYSRIGVQVPFTKEQQSAWFARLREQSAKLVLAICRRKDEVHLGNVSLDLIDQRHRNARMAVFIGDDTARGLGYGSEAVQLLLDHAFTTLQLHKVWCKTDAGYPALIRFYVKLGFKQEGILREHEIKEGRFVDKVLLAKIDRP
jgi:[ribosomal protein S5]-alanine N-acetyltransferase